MLLKWLALTLKMGQMHAILREILCPFIISTPKGWCRGRRHSLNPVNIFFSHLFDVTATNGSPSTNVYTRPYDDVVLIFVLKNKILLIANNRDTIILV